MTPSKEAEEEAARRWPPGGTGLPFPEYYGFIAGAEWMGAQVEELIQAARNVAEYGESSMDELFIALRTLDGSGQEA